MSRKTKKIYIISTNPAKNYEVIGKVAVSTDEEIRKAVENAHNAKRAWKEIGIAKRITLLRNIYEEIFKRREELVKLIVAETGKTVLFAHAEIDRHSQDVKWFLDHGEKILSDVVTYEDAKSIHRIVHEPRGATAVITPWNHPYGMFAWGVVPNLIAGNTVIYKISKESILVGKLLAEIMNSGNLPQGVFAEVYGDAAVGETLTDQTIDYLWFTGSTAVGKKLYQKSAKKFIGAVMELGGSNPAIMFDDVSVDDFIEKIYTKRFSTTCGQSCDSLKRLLVQEPIFDEVIEKLKKRFEKIVVGDPLDPKTNIASLVAKRQVDLLEEQVKDAVKKGAKVVIGGKRPKNLKGAYYLPTLLTNIKKSMRVWKEETFGPVLIIVPFTSEDEAVDLANETTYGLGSIVFSKDMNRARRVASRLESGTVEINNALHWLPCNPFGGYKESGMGREHGEVGLKELCQIKLISEEK